MSIESVMPSSHLILCCREIGVFRHVAPPTRLRLELPHKNSSAWSHKPQSNHHTTSDRRRMSNQMILLHKKRHKTGQKCSQNLQCLYILESTIEHFLLQGIFYSLGNVPKRSYSLRLEKWRVCDLDTDLSHLAGHSEVLALL